MIVVMDVKVVIDVMVAIDDSGGDIVNPPNSKLRSYTII
jgi:hypothetical protein